MLAVEEQRFGGQQLPGRGDQGLGAALLGTKEDRRDLRAGDVAHAEGVDHALRDGRLTGGEGVVHGVFEADPNIAVTSLPKTRQHEELQAFQAASLIAHFGLER